MIINIRGTDYSHNMSAHATAVLAGMNASLLSRKTLVLQLNNRASIERLLIGKNIEGETLINNAFAFEDDGIDALLLRAETQRLMKEHFDACCLSVLNADNLLDVAVASRKPNFEAELPQKMEQLESILIGAKEIYDDIFIFSNGKNEKIVDAFSTMETIKIDTTIVCIPQGPKEPVYGVEKLETDLNGKKPELAYLITRYDRYSTFNKRYIKNLYNAKNIFIMPYSIEFQDAYQNGTLMQFIKTNEKNSVNDINKDLVSNLRELIKALNEEAFHIDQEIPKLQSIEKNIPEKEITELTEEPNVKITEKKGLFGKKKDIIVEDLRSEDADEQQLAEEPLNAAMPDDSPSETKEKKKKKRAKNRKIVQPQSSTIDEEISVDETDEVIILEEEPAEEPDKKANKEAAKQEMEEFLDQYLEEEKEPQKPQIKKRKWRCPACGNINMQEEKHCVKCGLEKPHKAWFCPECGTKNEGHVKFCPECGEKRPE